MRQPSDEESHTPMSDPASLRHGADTPEQVSLEPQRMTKQEWRDALYSTVVFAEPCDLSAGSEAALERERRVVLGSERVECIDPG